MKPEGETNMDKSVSRDHHDRSFHELVGRESARSHGKFESYTRPTLAHQMAVLSRTQAINSMIPAYKSVDRSKSPLPIRNTRRVPNSGQSRSMSSDFDAFQAERRSRRNTMSQSPRSSSKSNRREATERKERYQQQQHSSTLSRPFILSTKIPEMSAEPYLYSHSHSPGSIGQNRCTSQMNMTSSDLEEGINLSLLLNGRDDSYNGNLNLVSIGRNNSKNDNDIDSSPYGQSYTDLNTMKSPVNSSIHMQKNQSPSVKDYSITKDYDKSLNSFSLIAGTEYFQSQQKLKLQSPTLSKPYSNNDVKMKETFTSNISEGGINVINTPYKHWSQNDTFGTPIISDNCDTKQALMDDLEPSIPTNSPDTPKPEIPKLKLKSVTEKMINTERLYKKINTEKTIVGVLMDSTGKFIYFDRIVL